MSYLLAAQSLFYLCAAVAWWRAWRSRSPLDLPGAAFWTGLCLSLSAFRIAVGIFVNELR